MQIGQIERQRSSMRELAEEYSPLLSDDARDTYVGLRPLVADMHPEQLEAMDRLFGVR